MPCGFVVAGSCHIYVFILPSGSRSKQESPADAKVTRDSSIIPGLRLFQDGRQPGILDIIEADIAPFDPLTPKTLA